MQRPLAGSGMLLPCLEMECLGSALSSEGLMGRAGYGHAGGPHHREAGHGLLPGPAGHLQHRLADPGGLLPGQGQSSLASTPQILTARV